jgi:hypothetical protein
MFGLDIGLALTLTTAFASALVAYRGLVRGQYAREREYAHIMRTLEQNRENIAHLLNEVDTVGDRLSRVEVLILRDSRHE